MTLTKIILFIELCGITQLIQSQKDLSNFKNSKIRKVILCSGKVYFDLLDAREKLKRDDIVMFRIEQLYPFQQKP